MADSIVADTADSIVADTVDSFAAGLDNPAAGDADLAYPACYYQRPDCPRRPSPSPKIKKTINSVFFFPLNKCPIVLLSCFVDNQSLINE